MWSLVVWRTPVPGQRIRGVGVVVGAYPILDAARDVWRVLAPVLPGRTVCAVGCFRVRLGCGDRVDRADIGRHGITADGLKMFFHRTAWLYPPQPDPEEGW